MSHRAREFYPSTSPDSKALTTDSQITLSLSSDTGSYGPKPQRQEKGYWRQSGINVTTLCNSAALQLREYNTPHLILFNMIDTLLLARKINPHIRRWGNEESLPNTHTYEINMD